MGPPAPGPPHGPGALRQRWALVGLCLGQFLSWGVLYYTLPVAATRIATDTGWPAAVVPGIYTVSLLSAASTARRGSGAPDLGDGTGARTAAVQAAGGSP